MTYQVTHAQGAQLAQVRPDVTTPVLLYTAEVLRTEMTLLLFAFTDAAPASVDISVYHDDDGTTFDDDSRVMSITVDTTVTLSSILGGYPFGFQAQHPGSGILIARGGSVAVQTSSADNVTFTMYGVTETLAERVRPGLMSS